MKRYCNESAMFFLLLFKCVYFFFYKNCEKLIYNGFLLLYLLIISVCFNVCIRIYCFVLFCLYSCLNMLFTVDAIFGDLTFRLKNTCAALRILQL